MHFFVAKLLSIAIITTHMSITSETYVQQICYAHSEYCKTLHFRCILISRFCNVEILLHFNLAFSHCSTSIYQAFDGQTEFSRVFNFVILSYSQNSRKFDAHEKYVFYSKLQHATAARVHDARPHCRLMLPPRGTSVNIRKNLILPKASVIGLHFCRRQNGCIIIQIFVVGSERRIFSATVCIGRSRSLILAPNE